MTSAGSQAPSREVSDLERRAQELTALYEASRDLSAQTDVDALLQTLMQRVTALLGNSSTTVFLYDADGGQVEVAASFGGTLPIGTRFGMDQGMTGRVAATRQPIIVADYQTWEHRIPELAARGVHAIMIVPMICAGELVGALGVSEYSTDRVYTDADARVLSMFAAYAAGAVHNAQLLAGARAAAADLLRDNVERRRIEQALRRSEERFRSLVEEMNDVVFTLGFDGVITYVSPALERLSGHAPDDLIGHAFADFIHPADLPELGKAFARVLEGQRDPTEFRVFTKDGNVRWVRSSSRRHVEDGFAVGITGSLTDVTERKLAEQALQESEARYRQLVEMSPDGIAVHRDGHIVFVNSAGVRLMGAADPSDLVGKPILQFVHPDDRPAVIARVQRLTEQQLADERTEERFLRVDGSVCDVEVTAMPLVYEGAHAVQVVVHDITARKHAEEALRASEERYRELVENANDLVYVHDLAGNFLAINRAAEHTTGYPREEALSRNIADLIAPEDLSRATELMHAVARGEEPPPSFEADIITKDGRRLTLEISPRPVLRDGVAVAVQGVARDVSERKRAADQIRLLNEALEQRVHERTAELAAANKELEAFGYSVSHDLRGPLRVIEGYSRLLLDEYGEALDDTARHYIQGVHGSSRRMAQLIQDLLNLSRITRNAIQRRRVDLAPLARATADELVRAHPQRLVEFVIPDRIVASGDRSMLRIVVENLLGNAWKYTSKHPRARIELGVREDGDGPCYFVRDDGAGFDMEYVGKLFQPFQRLHLVSEFEGTGIGLATVERIVRRHGGRVWAEGGVEKGATFYFTLAPGRAP